MPNLHKFTYFTSVISYLLSLIFRDLKNEEILVKLTYILQKIYSVKILLKIFNLKLDRDIDLIYKIPTPNYFEKLSIAQVYKQLKIEEILNQDLKKLKESVFTYKYIIYYIFEINSNCLEQVSTTEWLAQIINPYIDCDNDNEVLSEINMLFIVLSYKSIFNDKREKIDK